MSAADAQCRDKCNRHDSEQDLAEIDVVACNDVVEPELQGIAQDAACD